MHEHHKILLAVRAALHGAAVATAPALLATAVGVAHGRVTEPITRCEHGQERAVCAEHGVTHEPELDRHEPELPREPATSAPQSPPPADVPWRFWEDDADDETHRIVQENLRRQRNLIAPFVRAAPATDASK